ncbi:uncharacterized protein LOC119839138 [Zerene cesonia]|uniref:uncharacterized protein LOC119839138 n=1 Tax=Zerene cesonia TaxID=33412 RepID=UPI0018E4DDC0|nr:uncharacterized protein LOC119839138 [Zerene cesonia]
MSNTFSIYVKHLSNVYVVVCCVQIICCFTNMNKENNRSAAGLRRSAVAERLRLREEWLALKGVDDVNKQNRFLVKKPINVRTNKQPHNSKLPSKPKNYTNTITSDALRGVVAYVDVGAESRALALRAALMALGASVVPAWNPLVTHLIWTQGGCRKIRARGRALACQLVSPLWVEACAAEARRLPERLFPAPTRPSDLPSPATLRQLLKKAEHDNIPLADLLSDSRDSDEGKPARLRISSETENSLEKSKKLDESTDRSLNNSKDKSCDKSTDQDKRVNTAPRRALPVTPTSPPRTKSRRKLFTHKEAEFITDDGDKETPTPGRPKTIQLTQRGRKELVHAERIARKLVTSHRKQTQIQTQKPMRTHKYVPRIVLTGMSKSERREVCNALRTLNAKIQSQVNRKTTHVLLGSCREPIQDLSMCNQCNKPEDILEKLFSNINVMVEDHCNNGVNVASGTKVVCKNISGVNVLCDTSNCGRNNDSGNGDFVVNQLSADGGDENVEGNSVMCSAEAVNTIKPRTVNALLGAARGCRVLCGRWALDCAKEGRWLPHFGYEVPHLLKISQKARVERSALGRMRSEYAYDVFGGIKVHIQPSAFQKPAITQLLTLCGAVIQDGGSDVTIGTAEGEVSSKWVFDSVAAGRMRTTRRYVNKNIPTEVVNLTQDCV